MKTCSNQRAFKEPAQPEHVQMGYGIGMLQRLKPPPRTSLQHRDWEDCIRLSPQLYRILNSTADVT